MIESPVIERLLARRMHRAILRTLKDRFGQVSVEVEQTLSQVKDDELLDDLISCAATCPTLAAFASQLAAKK